MSTFESTQMPKDYTLPHLPSRQPVCTSTNSNNLSFQVTVLINGLPVHCLIDSGAIIKHDLLHNNEWMELICQSCVLAKGANGMPLETKGQVELPIKLGGLDLTHTFMIDSMETREYSRANGSKIHS